MKKGSFAGLLYREFYLGKHSYITGLLFFAGTAILGWLSLLSMKYGNFGLLFDEELSGSIIKNKDLAEAIRFMILVFMKYCSAFMACAIGLGAVSDVACKDVMNKWSRFEHCTPVTPLKFTAVKTISMFISTAISFILVIVYIFTIDMGLGEKFSYTDISLTLLFLAFGTVIGVLSQIFVMLLKDRDKGMLCATFAMMTPICIIGYINGKNERDISKDVDFKTILAELNEKAQVYFPVILIVLAVSFAVLFVSMYLLYKRREK